MTAMKIPQRVGFIWLVWTKNFVSGHNLLEMTSRVLKPALRNYIKYFTFRGPPKNHVMGPLKNQLFTKFKKISGTRSILNIKLSLGKTHQDLKLGLER